MSVLRFQQIDVFANQPMMGNPLALVHDAEDLTDEEMARLARWTNLSETAFLLPPTNPQADYRVRIWTPRRELPFAGHPTLGSCHGWLSCSIKPKAPDCIVQECAIGLVKIRRDGSRLAFAAPPLLKSGPVDPVTLKAIAQGLNLSLSQIVAHQIVDNGPGWVALLLDSAKHVLEIRPDASALVPYKVGVAGPYPQGHEAQFEVRAFAADAGGGEDPVTGSLNAGIASWFIQAGIAPGNYVVSQGTALGRQGRLYIQQIDGQIWVAGQSLTTIEGTLSL